MNLKKGRKKAELNEKEIIFFSYVSMILLSISYLVFTAIPIALYPEVLEPETELVYVRKYCYAYLISSSAMFLSVPLLTYLAREIEYKVKKSVVLTGFPYWIIVVLLLIMFFWLNKAFVAERILDQCSYTGPDFIRVIRYLSEH